MVCFKKFNSVIATYQCFVLGLSKKGLIIQMLIMVEMVNSSDSLHVTRHLQLKKSVSYKFPHLRSLRLDFIQTKKFQQLPTTI